MRYKPAKNDFGTLIASKNIGIYKTGVAEMNPPGKAKVQWITHFSSYQRQAMLSLQQKSDSP
jgi:hypothetical protein